jgi:hypothetical protein
VATNGGLVMELFCRTTDCAARGAQEVYQVHWRRAAAKGTGLPIYFVMAAMEASSSKNGPRSGQEHLPEGKWSSGVAGIIIIVLFEPLHAYPPRLVGYDRLLPAV